MGVIETFNLTGTIAFKMPFNNNDIITIYDGTPKVDSRLVPANTIVSANSFIKNLKATASIKSVLPASMPDFQIDDSTTTKTYKMLDVEWKSARKQANMFISNAATQMSTLGGWQKVFSFSLLNAQGYPFRNYALKDAYTDALAIELGADGKIGIGIEDVGFGLLDFEDEMTVYGSWVQEIVVANPNPAPIYNFYNSFSSNFASSSGSVEVIDEDSLVAVGTP